MKRFLGILPLMGLALALSCGAAAASDYYVTDDNGYVYDNSSDWYTSAPSDTYGYYDRSYVYSTPDPYYDGWYGGGVGVGINIGGDHDRDYWRHSDYGRGYSRDSGFRNEGVRSDAGYRSGNSAAVRSSGSSGGSVRSSGGGGRSSGGGHGGGRR